MSLSNSDDDYSPKKGKEYIPQFIELLKQGEKPYMIEKSDSSEQNMDIEIT